MIDSEKTKDENFNKCLLLLKEQKNKCQTLQKRVNILEYESMKMSVRAAVSFHELTPRYKPGYEEIFKELKLRKP